MIILIQIILTLSFSSAEENSVTQLKKAQSKLRTEIKKLIATPSCKQNSDCGVVEMGNSGGCGNPDTFWAHSLKKETAKKLKTLVQMERQVAYKIVQKTQSKDGDMIMGACGYKSPQVKCVNQLCHL